MRREADGLNGGRKRLVVDQSGCAGVLKDEGHLLGIQQEVDGHDNGACFKDAEVGDGEGVGVHAVEADAVAGCDTTGGQCGGDALGCAVELGEGQGAAAEDDGSVLGVLPGRSGHQTVQRVGDKLHGSLREFRSLGDCPAADKSYEPAA